jgi:hypothetical protein
VHNKQELLARTMKGNSKMHYCTIRIRARMHGAERRGGEKRKAWVLRISSGGNVASEMHMQRLDLHAGAVTLRT